MTLAWIHSRGLAARSAVMYFVTDLLVPAEFAIAGVEYTSLGVYLCFLTGLIAGPSWA